MELTEEEVIARSIDKMSHFQVMCIFEKIQRKSKEEILYALEAAAMQNS